jgi:hypothetical protein
LLELLACLAAGKLSHSAFEHGLENQSLVLHSRTLEDVIAGVGHGLLHSLLGLTLLLVDVTACLGYNAFS